ncbi:MAG: efflux RND transporter periplasmic adaptor subunit [Vicinamibacteria bacterium]|nr:efflux RND transporter periplasmic adaptor subunit [Vicinamibacteria bacterium]
MSELRNDLAALKIERDAPVASRRWPVFLLLPAVLFLGALYVLRFQDRAIEVATVKVTRTEVSAESIAAGHAGAPLLTASGYIVARRKAVVSAKIQGRLSSLRVEEGSRVREGEIIARLENRDYLAQVERAEASVQRSEADLAEASRQKRVAADLERQQIGTKDTLEAASSRVAVTEAALRQARADAEFYRAVLANTEIRAPFSGTVVKKMAEVGESVAPIPPGVNISTASGAIVALADLDTLEVEVDVAESNVAKLSADQPAEVTAEAFPDRKFNGRLRQIIPTADRTKATVQVKVTILDKDKDLKPEMSARVQFTEKAVPVNRSIAGGASDLGAAVQSVVTAPESAIVTRDGASVAFEIVEGRAKRRVVEVTSKNGGAARIKKGLYGGETLVDAPPVNLQDGDSVRPKAN